MSCLALVDCNAFYVSCERLFAPALRRRAVVVLSNNDGCVVARSPEAKALPVAMGAPAFTLRPLIEAGRLVACSSNYVLYGDVSQRVMQTLAGFGRAQEVYSIDECFLDLGGDGDPVAGMIEARRTVARHVGIPVSVGIAATKTLAKLANHLAKNDPEGVCRLPPPGPQLATRLASVPVAEVWGVGRRIAAALADWGVVTALDLARAAPARLRAGFGLAGERLVRELRGELARHPAVRTVEGEPPDEHRELRATLDPSWFDRPGETASLRVTWIPGPSPGPEASDRANDTRARTPIQAYYTLHYSESGGTDCGFHCEPNPHVDGLLHYQERENPNNAYTYEPVSFGARSVTGLLWEMMDAIANRLGNPD